MLTSRSHFGLKYHDTEALIFMKCGPPPCSVCLLAGPLLQLRRVMSCTVPELWQVLLLDFGWARGAFGRLVGLSRLRCTALVCNCRHMFAGCLHAKCMCM